MRGTAHGARRRAGTSASAAHGTKVNFETKNWKREMAQNEQIWSRLSVEIRIGGVIAAWRRSKIIAPWIQVGGYSWWHDGIAWKREDRLCRA